MKPFLSIIIPVYNEERRIAKAFTALKAFEKTYRFDTEVLFVNDGSQDKTQQLIKQYQKKHAQTRLVSYKKNRGKGYALKAGIRTATGRWVLLIDADMSIPLGEFTKFYPLMHTGKSPMLVGVRSAASRIHAQQGLLRRLLSSGFRGVSSLITGVRAPDITCGFKCFETKTAKLLYGQLITDRWAYDTEVFLLAKKHGIPRQTVPITWNEDTQTRVRLVHAALQSLRDLLKMRLHHGKNPIRPHITSKKG